MSRPAQHSGRSGGTAWPVTSLRSRGRSPSMPQAASRGSDLLLADMQAAARRKAPEDLQAYDLTVMAYNAFLKGREADTLKGIEYADRAITRDPDFARAYIQKAWLLQDLAKYRKNWNEATREMESLARTGDPARPLRCERSHPARLGARHTRPERRGAGRDESCAGTQSQLRGHPEHRRRFDVLPGQAGGGSGDVRAVVPAQPDSARLVRTRTAWPTSISSAATGRRSRR